MKKFILLGIIVADVWTQNQAQNFRLDLYKGEIPN
jgi:hypothetical protein